MAATKRRSGRKKKKEVEIDASRLHECSDTELVQIARSIGFVHVSRQILREDIIAIILGEEIEIEDPLAGIRERTYAYVQGNQSIMRSLLKCDLQCPACPHDQVLECYSVNHDKVDPE